MAIMTPDNPLWTSVATNRSGRVTPVNRLPHTGVPGLGKLPGTKQQNFKNEHSFGNKPLKLVFKSACIKRAVNAGCL